MPIDTNHSTEDVIGKLLVDFGLGQQTDVANDWFVYVNSLPHDPDNAIAVYGSESRTQGRIQQTGRIVEQYGFQVYLRSNTYEVGRSKMSAIGSKFDKEVKRTNVTIDGTNYLIHAITRYGSVLFVGTEQPQGTRKEFSLNCVVTFNQLED